MNQRVVVAQQFRGPPESGNGGYVSGLLAGYLSPLAAAEGVEQRPLRERVYPDDGALLGGRRLRWT